MRAKLILGAVVVLLCWVLFSFHQRMDAHASPILLALVAVIGPANLAGMKPYLVTTGTIFGLITLAHFWRMIGENHGLAVDPFLLALTVLSAFLCGWAFWLLRRSQI